MHIEVYKTGALWDWKIVGGNKKTIGESCDSYANKRNALKTAKAVAGKLKVIERE